MHRRLFVDFEAAVKEVLKDRGPDLRNAINVTGLLSELKFLSTQDIQIIECRHRNEEQLRGADALLSALRRKHHGFLQFLAVLTCHGHELLAESIFKDLQKIYRGDLSLEYQKLRDEFIQLKSHIPDWVPDSDGQAPVQQVAHPPSPQHLVDQHQVYLHHQGLPPPAPGHMEVVYQGTLHATQGASNGGHSGVLAIPFKGSELPLDNLPSVHQDVDSRMPVVNGSETPVDHRPPEVVNRRPPIRDDPPPRDDPGGAVGGQDHGISEAGPATRLMRMMSGTYDTLAAELNTQGPDGTPLWRTLANYSKHFTRADIKKLSSGNPGEDVLDKLGEEHGWTIADLSETFLKDVSAFAHALEILREQYTGLNLPTIPASSSRTEQQTSHSEANFKMDLASFDDNNLNQAKERTRTEMPDKNIPGSIDLSLEDNESCKSLPLNEDQSGLFSYNQQFHSLPSSPWKEKPSPAKEENISSPIQDSGQGDSSVVTRGLPSGAIHHVTGKPSDDIATLHETAETDIQDARSLTAEPAHNTARSQQKAVEDIANMSTEPNTDARTAAEGDDESVAHSSRSFFSSGSLPTVVPAKGPSKLNSGQMNSDGGSMSEDHISSMDQETPTLVDSGEASRDLKVQMPVQVEDPGGKAYSPELDLQSLSENRQEYFGRKREEQSCTQVTEDQLGKTAQLNPDAERRQFQEDLREQLEQSPHYLNSYHDIQKGERTVPSEEIEGVEAESNNLTSPTGESNTPVEVESDPLGKQSTHNATMDREHLRQERTEQFVADEDMLQSYQDLQKGGTSEEAGGTESVEDVEDEEPEEERRQSEGGRETGQN